VSELHPRAAAVVAAAQQQGLAIEVHEHVDGARTAADAAAAIGVDVGQIVKSLVFRVDDEVVLALVSGPNRLDEGRLAAASGGEEVRQAKAEVVRSATGYAIGGVPPFGHATELRTFVDEDLLAYDVVWAAAGTPRHVFPVAPDDLLRLTRGTSVPLTA
jgi:Cys-tRNA(Pro) deacylase